VCQPYASYRASTSSRNATLVSPSMEMWLLDRPAHDDNYNPTYTPANRTELVNVSGYRTFRQVAWGGSFEGQTTIGLGVRARLPFRVFTLDGPGSGSRIVIDVAHRW
jgi:hypothetical protein